MDKISGIALTSGPLRARIVDNSPRHSHMSDSMMDGMNGVAALIHEEQNKNIYASCGLNYECASTDPPAGKRQDCWDAPRQASLHLERIDENTARLRQKASETSGLNIEFDYHLHAPYLDHTLTIWPDHNITFARTFWASYMNQVQNTSLFLRGALEDESEVRWYEAASVGHSGDGLVRFRPFDPIGKSWHEHLRDNPLLRQSRFQTEESRRAAEEMGFRAGRLKEFDRFFYGFIDDFLLLYIFREPEFHMWISASGGMALRSPAWDYEIRSGAQKAGERRTFHVRIVYKPFEDVEGVLEEVEKFQQGGEE